MLTDSQHVSGFKLQGMIVQKLIQAVELPNIIDPAQPLLDEQKQPHSMPSNKIFVQNLLASLLLKMFPNLNRVQVETFVLKLFNTSGQWSDFKGNLRDLLVSMKQFASLNDALYAEERNQQIQVEQQRRQAIPGMQRTQ